MSPLKVAFSDFIFNAHATDKFGSFNPTDNVFTRLLAPEYDVRTVPLAEADVLIYSTFGRTHQTFRGRKIFFTSENVLPDFGECDFAISFSHLPDEPRHFRLPQYVFYVEDPALLIKGVDFDADAILQAKRKFCNFIVSNPRCPERNRFFRKLHRRRHVDSGGRHFNNLGAPISDKPSFIRDYKFTLAFENSSSSGYTTEKLVEPMIAGSLPIYWGNPEVARDFNPRSFINVSDFPSFDAAIDHIMAVDADDNLFLSYLREPWFNGNTPPEWFHPSIQLQALQRFLTMSPAGGPRIYRNRKLREHTYANGVQGAISSLACRLDGLLWKAGWR